MGDDLTEKRERQKRPNTISEIFRMAFPQYLAIGMTAEQFWDGEGWLVKSYREAHRIRMETDLRVRDRDAWNLGNYIRHALVSVGITVNGFAPKNHRLSPYPERPFVEKYDAEKAEGEKEEARKKAQENQQTLAKAMFQAFAEKMNRGIRDRLEKEKNGESCADT